MKRSLFAAFAVLILAALCSTPLAAADYLQFSYSNQIPGLPTLGGPLQIYTSYWVASDAASVTLTIQTSQGAMGYSQNTVQGGTRGSAIFTFPVPPWEIIGGPLIVEHATAAPLSIPRKPSPTLRR